MSDPLFSVVIPTYNRSAQLKRALNSLVSQTYKDFEVIVCDDGSTDNTNEIVEQFRNVLNIKYFREENWGGPARPRNMGIKLASSDWICFLDSDDTCFPKKLEHFKNSTQDYDVIYHNLLGINVSKNNALVTSVFDHILLEGHGNLIISSACIRKTILNAINGFDENIAGGGGAEDYDLFLRIAKITERFKHIPINLGEYHFEDTNLHHDVYRMYTGTIQTLNKYKDHSLFRKALKRRLIHYFPYLAVFHKKEGLKIFTSVASLNLSFVTGALLLLIPSVITKSVMKILIKNFFKEYYYLLK